RKHWASLKSRRPTWGWQRWPGSGSPPSAGTCACRSFVSPRRRRSPAEGVVVAGTPKWQRGWCWSSSPLCGLRKKDHDGDTHTSGKLNGGASIMPHFICTTCGTQHAEGDQPPAACAICQDERQYVKVTGQQWTTLDRLRLTHRNSIRFEEPGLIGIGIEPHF